MEVLICLTPFIVLFVCLGLVLWLNSRNKRTNPNAIQVPIQAAPIIPSGQDTANEAINEVWNSGVFDLMERLIGRWVGQKRLDLPTAERLFALLQEDRLALAAPAMAMAVAAPAPMQVPVATPVPDPVPTPTPKPTATPEPAQPKPSLTQRVFGGFLALHSRQVILFLGVFLLLVSALILVLFNWASFPPFLQFLLLLSLSATLWGAGEWIAKNWELKGAGFGLQIASAVLLPITFFALSRPGLLDLSYDNGLILAAGISSVAFALMTWRSQRQLFAIFSMLMASLAGILFARFHLGMEYQLAVFLLVQSLISIGIDWLQKHTKLELSLLFWLTDMSITFAGLAVLYWPLLYGFEFGTSAASIAYLFGVIVVHRQFNYSLYAWLLPFASTFALFTIAMQLMLHGPYWALIYVWLPITWLLCFAMWVANKRWDDNVVIESGLRVSIVRATLILWTSIAALSAIFANTELISVVGYALAIWFYYQVFALCVADEKQKNDTLATRLFALAGLSAAILLAPFAWMQLRDTLFINLPLLSPIPINLWLLAIIGFAFWLYQQGRVLREINPLYEDFAYDRVIQVCVALILFVSVLLLDQTISWQVWLFSFALLILFAVQIWRFHLIQWINLFYVSVIFFAFASVFFASDLAELNYWVRNSAYWHLIGALGLLFGVGGAYLEHRKQHLFGRSALVWGLAISALFFVNQGLDPIGLDLALFSPSQNFGWLVAYGLGFTVVSVLLRQRWLGFVAGAVFSWAGFILIDSDLFGYTILNGDERAWIMVAIAAILALIAVGMKRWYGTTRQFVSYALFWLMLSPLVAEAYFGSQMIIWGLLMVAFVGTLIYSRLIGFIAPVVGSAMVFGLHTAGYLNPHWVNETYNFTWLLLAYGIALSSYLLWYSRNQDFRTPFAQHPETLLFVLNTVALFCALFQSSGNRIVFASVFLTYGALILALTIIKRRETPILLSLLLFNTSLILFLDVYRIAFTSHLQILMISFLVLVGFSALLQRSSDALHKKWALHIQLYSATIGLVMLVLAIIFPANTEQLLFTRVLVVVGYAILLSLIAVIRRSITVGYAASGVLMIGLLLQLFDLGFRAPQLYSMLLALYFILIAICVRRFQGYHATSRLIETGALLLLFGTTIGQAVTGDTVFNQTYALLLVGQALAALVYGIVFKLRVPFIAGTLGVMLGVLMLGVDPMLAMNKWILMGLLGITLVGLYVLLERRQDELRRLGMLWIDRVRAWQ